jgi:hypothetical protein
MTLGFLRLRALEHKIRAESWDSKMRQGELQITVEKAPRASEGEGTSKVRRQIRYPLRAPVTFIWMGRDGVQYEGKGNSRDISECGIYIVTKNSPSMGALVMLAIRFPYLPELDRFHRIEMNGRVVRVDLLLDSRAGWGFAVSSERTVLQEVEDEENGKGSSGRQLGPNSF